MSDDRDNHHWFSSSLLRVGFDFHSFSSVVLLFRFGPNIMETTPTPTVVDIDPQAFRTARERYIDDNKPDPLVRQQIESWTLQWHPSTVTSPPSASFAAPTHWLAGEAVWEAEYLTLTLCVICYWKGTRKDGSIHFSCDVVKGEFTGAPQRDSTAVSDVDDNDPKEARAAKRVHQKMIERLRNDDYIAKLAKKDIRQNLMEATVILNSNELEERVYCDETAAEGIRRGIFTTAENSLDVFDWIVSLPFLPSCAHDDAGISATTPLADRVKLRCLEEATYDTCEQQDAEEIVEELHISKKPKTK